MAPKVKTGIEHTIGVPHLEELEQHVDIDVANSMNISTLTDFIKSLPTKGDEPDEEDSLYTMDDDEDEDIEPPEEQPELEELMRAMKDLRQMRVVLRDIPTLASRKKMLEKLAERAEKHFEDVMDMAFDSEEKYSANIINAAAKLLQTAISAHAKVLEADVKLVDLQIKKDKYEIELNIKSQGGNSKPEQDVTQPEDGEERIAYNRNDLIR